MGREYSAKFELVELFSSFADSPFTRKYLYHRLLDLLPGLREFPSSLSYTLTVRNGICHLEALHEITGLLRVRHVQQASSLPELTTQLAKDISICLRAFGIDVDSEPSVETAKAVVWLKNFQDGNM